MMMSQIIFLILSYQGSTSALFPYNMEIAVHRLNHRHGGQLPLPNKGSAVSGIVFTVFMWQVLFTVHQGHSNNPNILQAFNNFLCIIM